MTYFLQSKDGFVRQMPDLSKAIPLTEHIFK